MLSKIRNYLQLLGRRIDQVVLDHEEEPYKQDSMCSSIIIIIMSILSVQFELMILFSFSGKDIGD